jgi:hypothetical protein
MTAVRDLRPGDVIDVLGYPCTVAAVEHPGSYVMGSTERRILRVTFSAGPRVIRALEKAEDAPVDVLATA